MRIHEFASQLGVKSADVIAELERLGVKDKKASSTMDEAHIDEVTDNLSEKPDAKKPPKAKAAKPAPKKEKETAKKAVAKKPKAETDEAEKKATAQKAEEARKKAEEEQRQKAEEARKKAEEEQRKKAEEARQKAEEEKRRKAEEAQQRAKEKAEMEELREIEKQIEEEEARKREEEARQIVIDEAITVKEFSDKLKISVNEIIKKLFLKGIAVTVNQTLGIELLQDLARELGFTIKVKMAEEKEKEEKADVDTSQFPARPPVVTVMGHVDHGKTSLLDALRKTDVAAREAGGITQHIGAYSINTGKSTITFLDTPGHEAFTALRARGAKVTDLVVLVVAADDGVMPQTEEAINHAKAAGVEILVAVNKIDKPNAQPEKVKQELTKYGLVPEDWGGQTIFCNVSAKTGDGLDSLLEMIELQAEVLDLRADPTQPATATVIESKLDKSRGPVHSIIVTRGTLKMGDPFVLGLNYGKVRAMIDDKGHKLKDAGPSTPLELLGSNSLSDAGEILAVVENERKARQISETRQAEIRDKRLAAKQHVSLENVVETLGEGGQIELKLVIKADTQGSVEAVKELLSKIKHEQVKLHVIHSGVGGITETDVMLADASDAIVIGFNIRPTEKAKNLAEQSKIDMRLYSIIYEINDDMENAIRGMLKPKIVEKVTGQAQVRETYKISKIGVIAGCMVISGTVKRNSSCRLIRDNVVIHTGSISSLRRFKDDVREVQSGYECGISLEKYNDIKVGDVIELFEDEEIKQDF